MTRPLLCICLALLATPAAAWQAPDAPAIRAAQQARDSARLEQQRARLTAVRTELRAAQQKASRDDRQRRELEAALSQQTAELERRRADLAQQTAAVRDVYTTARQTAGDLIGLMRATPTQPPDLEPRLARLATSETALDLDALAGLWEALHVTLTDTATQSRQDLPVQTAPAKLEQMAVTRIGQVLAITAAGPVVYDRIAGVYRTTTDSRPAGAAARLAAARDGMVQASFAPVPVNNTGAEPVLAALRQSGPIGIVIVSLGTLGLIVLILRLLRLQYILRAERIGSATSASRRLREELREHQNENRDSLAGWLYARVRREARHAQWGHGALTIIIGVAPLLGLLGTVTGMIVTFHSLRLYGGGDPVLMAGGIAQALSTTLLGLTVAIPLLLGQRWLLAQANRHIHRLDSLVPALIAARSNP